MQVATAAGASRYNLPIGTQLGQDGQPEPDPSTKQLLAGMTPQSLHAAAERLAQADPNDPHVQLARQLVAQELQAREPANARMIKQNNAASAAQAKAATSAKAKAASAAQSNAKKAAAAQASANKKAATAKAAAAIKAAAAKAAAQKKAAAAQKKAQAAAAKPHWFTAGPADAIELTSYSSEGPRVTDRYGNPVAGPDAGTLASHPTGTDSGEGGEGTGPDSPGSGTWLKVQDVHAPRGPRSNARKLGEVHRRQNGSGAPYRAVAASGKVISYHHSPARATAAVAGQGG